MPETMRALRVHAPAAIATAPLRADRVPVPEPGPGEVRVRVTACAICRTDLHVIEGDLPFPGRPVVPGHQVVGVVDALGPGVRGFAPGERAGIAWLRSTCGTCRDCAEGRENLCDRARFTGYHADGGYAEYALAPADFAYHLPPGIADVEAAPLLCAGIIGYRALRRSGIRPGGRLALFGFGSSAHISLQVARHWGCEVLVVTRGARHRDLARALGAAWVGGPGEAPPALADAAIVFAPAGEVVPPALEAVGKGGTVALAGIHMTDIPRLDYDRHLFREKVLTSVTANTREDGRGLFAVAEAAGLRPRTTVFPLAAANQALLALARDEIAGTGVLVP
jgi:propanol-preferring alcohol dehydrogenase